MKIFRNNLNKAFTLMEVGLSLLIISILVIVCIPIVTSQAKKTDEYAYYAAFKTVEKMGSQIVAYGDPDIIYNSDDSDDVAVNPKGSKYFENYISFYLRKVINGLAPSAFAAVETSEVVSFASYEYDFAKICLNNRNVMRDYEGYAGQTYNDPVFDDEVLAIQASSLCLNFKKDNFDFIKKRFMCANMSSINSTAAFNILDGHEESKKDYTMREYCLWLAEHCPNADNCESGNCYRRLTLGDKQYDQCTITIQYPESNDEPLSDVEDLTINEEVSCDKYGFVNMVNGLSGTRFSCSCASEYPVKALNNSNVCCQQPASGKYSYYAQSKSNPCVECELNAFNEKTDDCCPDNSVYSKALQKCICNEGYTMNNAVNPSKCDANPAGQGCGAGTHLQDGKCVSNSPIVSAQRFCELVAYNWNVTSSNCNTFEEYGNDPVKVNYNKNLYDAITAGNTPYLSVKAVEGAFIKKNQSGQYVTPPNITFANGLMMWILGDKAASISGLSFNPDTYSPEMNVCAQDASKTKDTCSGGTYYYCKNDEKCFSVEQGSISGDVPKLNDARNCCSTADFTDLMPLYEADEYLRDPRAYAISGFTVFIDINGTKDNDEVGGGGTLWKDVFPFYVSSNGKVYPGYPLNAAKASNSSDKDSASLYQGGNSSAITADVFYYDLVGGKRRKINVYPAMPYARALCFSLELSAYTPYCQNLGTKYRVDINENSIDKFLYSNDNPCYKHRCFLKVKNKIKFL